MQWLIDIIKAWIVAQGYLTAGFVDRGDPTTFDFSKDNLILDGNFHELDLSGIVPEKAKAVLFCLRFNAAIITGRFYFRKAGNVNVLNVSRGRVEVAGVDDSDDYVCPISSDRKLEYMFTYVPWTMIFFYVKGWWL